MATKMIVVILVFSFIGIKVDEHVSIEFPIFTMVFVFLGVILAMYTMIKDVLK